MSRCWVYHPTEAPKIVDESEAEAYYEKGWSDTPATFLDLSGVVDLEDDVQVQVTGQVMEEMKDRANDALTAQTARRKGLNKLAEQYEMENFEDLETKDLRAAVISKITEE